MANTSSLSARPLGILAPYLVAVYELTQLPVKLRHGEAVGFDDLRDDVL